MKTQLPYSTPVKFNIKEMMTTGQISEELGIERCKLE